MKILIVEDEAFSRQLLQGYLEKLGQEVVAASDGLEAWERFQQDEFSLVITDWVMPGLDGLELVQRIRGRQSGSYVYVILLTAKADAKDVVQGIMEGADDYLSKPYDRDELRVRVRAGERVVELEKRLTRRNAELAAAKSDLEQANAQLGKVNKRMKDDLERAADVQRSLLPTQELENWAADAWIFRPCDELAGDIFNVFQLDDDHIGFYLLDVVGHGVSAALLSVTLSRFLSPTTGSSSVLFYPDGAGHRLLSPSEVAAELNKRFPMDEGTWQYFTLLLGFFNVKTRELRFVSAGHPGPIYAPASDRPRALDVAGYPIGIVEQPGYDDQSIVLNPGDRVFLYSDGLIDATNSNGDCFGKTGLIALVTERQHSLQATMLSLEKSVVDWCDGRPDDDISVLAMGMFPED